MLASSITRKRSVAKKDLVEGQGLDPLGTTEISGSANTAPARDEASATLRMPQGGMVGGRIRRAGSRGDR